MDRSMKRRLDNLEGFKEKKETVILKVPYMEDLILQEQMQQEAVAKHVQEHGPISKKALVVFVRGFMDISKQ